MMEASIKIQLAEDKFKMKDFLNKLKNLRRSL